MAHAASQEGAIEVARHLGHPMKSKKRKQPRGNAFDYSMSMELAMCQLFGLKSRWAGLAGGFKSSARVRRALLAAAKRIRRHIAGIVTIDFRLCITLSSQLDSIEHAARRIRPSGNGLLEVIADLLHFIALLLGYDWTRGRTNRTLSYSQDAGQVALDDDYSGDPGQSVFHRISTEEKTRAGVIVQLHRKGATPRRIAVIMNMPEHRVRSSLVQAGRLTRLSITPPKRAPRTK